MNGGRRSTRIVLCIIRESCAGPSLFVSDCGGFNVYYRRYRRKLAVPAHSAFWPRLRFSFSVAPARVCNRFDSVYVEFSTHWFDLCRAFTGINVPDIVPPADGDSDEDSKAGEVKASPASTGQYYSNPSHLLVRSGPSLPPSVILPPQKLGQERRLSPTRTATKLSEIDFTSTTGVVSGE